LSSQNSSRVRDPSREASPWHPLPRFTRPGWVSRPQLKRVSSTSWAARATASPALDSTSWRTAPGAGRPSPAAPGPAGGAWGLSPLVTSGVAGGSCSRRPPPRRCVAGQLVGHCGRGASGAMNSRVSQVAGPPPTGDGRDSATEPPGAGAGPSSSRPTVPTTRTGSVWWALGFSMLLLVLVLVFVLQNLSSASTSFFSVKWTIPLGLDLLLASLLGGVIAFLLGTARMLQLRRVARRYSRTQGPP
jgi:uncharacterized integral membrane protein